MLFQPNECAEISYGIAFALNSLNPQGFLLVQSNEMVKHKIFHLF